MIYYQEEDLRSLKLIVEAAQKPYLSVNEGMQLYCLGRNTTIRLAKESGAIRKIGTKILINVKVFNEYIESMYS